MIEVEMGGVESRFIFLGYFRFILIRLSKIYIKGVIFRINEFYL